MPIRRQALIVVAFVAVAVAPSIANADHRNPSCLVPNVKGATLKTAEKRLRARHCAVGLVTGPRTAFVSAEAPKAGQHRKHGARVALTLKRRAVASKTKSAVTSVGTGAKPSATVGTQPLGIPGSWHLALDSEFNSTRLPTDWRTGWFGGGITSPINGNEIDCYSPNNVTFPGDGTMHLVVSAQPSTCGGTTEPYTGSLVNTDPEDGRSGPGFQYTYGVLEARVYLPADSGRIADWPAFWAGGQHWPATGEDDVMEGIHGYAVWSFHNAQELRNSTVPNIGPGWHTFASDWEPGSLTFYYDGTEVGSLTTGVTSSPMYIVLANTVASSTVAGAAAVTEPDAMEVQYVRVWQH